MDNIGPIALFVLYMAISAWAKKNKARQRAAREAEPAGENPPQASFMGGIFEQLKKELLEDEAEPLVIPYEETVVEPEVEVIVDEPTRQFVEGSDSAWTNEVSASSQPSASSNSNARTLDAILATYSGIQQGILLHEILGKPRAYQDDDEWFHRS